LAESKPSWWGRLLGRSSPTETEDAAPDGDAGGAAAAQELPVSGAVVGLCFDYERDLAFDSAELSDNGLEHILTVLRRHKLRATFNCAAKLCEEVAHQIRTIADAGHEIACLGYAGESWADVEPGLAKELVFKCRNAFAKAGYSPIGFRSKSTQCTPVVAKELQLQRFRYNSQHDHGKHPYVLIPGDRALARVPVATDDRGFTWAKKTGKITENEVVSKHHRYLRKAIARKHFVSIGFHPWILAEEDSRMREWELWLETAIKGGARIGALEDALPASYRKLTPAEDEE